MILDATQFRQLVAEVSMTIAADSTGVGEIEIVDSLAGITSLPALKIVYGRETVVEAPLSLLSKRADDAAQEAQEAIAAADGASVLASAAADRADAERVNLEEIKHLTQLATSEALTQTNVSKDETRLTGETRLATLATLTDLQRKLVDVVIVIADAHTGVEELAEYQKRADEVLFIVARNTEELLKISEELKTLRAQVAEVTRQAFVAIAACNLSTDDARLFASLAQQAAEVANIAGAGADVAGEYARLQAFDAEVAAKEARDTSVELQKSIVASDSIAALAKENALLANDAAKGAELEVEESALLRQELTHIAEQAEQASNRAIDSAAGAAAAAAHAKEQAEAAKVAMQDATDTSTHPTFIGDDYYVYVWDKATKAYNKTAIFVKGDAFSFAKSYTTISEMESDFSNVTEGRFVLINTNDAEQTDNAKIYIRTENNFEFLVDMSGAIGFSGKTPQFIKGEITTGDAGTGAQVSLSEAGIDGNGNPIYALNIVIPRGNRGMDGTPCTHSWEGTVLTVTSASGTSSANLKGEIGQQGVQGIKGDTGAVGAQGVQGERGYTGSQGVAGATGLQGERGYTGAIGGQGAKGDKGDKGDTGSQGIQGDTGSVGATGPQGERGYTGAQGATGAQGQKGETGSQGQQGAQGLKGDTGTVDISTLETYAKADFSNATSKSMGQNGYYKLPDGLLIQWGYVSAMSPSKTVYFPTYFYDSNYSIVTNIIASSSTLAAVTSIITSKNTSYFSMKGRYVGTNAKIEDCYEACHWFAIGRWK